MNRYVAVLGKFRVIHVKKGFLGTSFTLQLPKGVTLSTDLPVQRADVRVGDMLTLYTEVLREEKDFKNEPKGG